MPRLTESIIDAYLKYTEGHESTERVRKWCIIPVIAAALERRVWIHRGHYLLFPNLYTFIIGRSGFVKKSTSTSIAVNLLQELPKFKLMSQRLTAASLIDQMGNAGKPFMWNGNKIHQSPLFAYASELAVFLQEVWGSITEVLTDLYDCKPNNPKDPVNSVPWRYSTIGRGETKIYGACLNILGASTKAWLQKCVPRSEMEGGFTSRIIFVVEDRMPDKLVAWPQVDDELEKVRTMLVHDLKEVYSLAGPFTIDPKAKAMFQAWYHEHMTNTVPKNQDPRMSGYMARKGETILKIAMAHSVSKSNAMILMPEDLKWAELEINDLENDWRLAFDGVGIVKSLGKELLDHIRVKAVVESKEISEVFGKRTQLSEIAQALEDLMGMGEIEESKVMKEGVEVTVYHTPGALSISWS